MIIGNSCKLSYYDNFVGSLHKAAKLSIPWRKGFSVRKIGWNEDIKELKWEAKEKFLLWQSAGKPLAGDLHSAMFMSRKHFKRRVKKLKLKEREDLCKNLMKDIKDENPMDSWKKIRYELGTSSVSKPTRIGDAISEDKILNLWKPHFGAITNSESEPKTMKNVH